MRGERNILETNECDMILERELWEIDLQTTIRLSMSRGARGNADYYEYN